MLKREIARSAKGRVLLVDSITQLAPGDAGAIVVAGSHGGRSSAEFALETPLAAVFFNDAGVGKDEAGIAALAHTSARIGDAMDAWAQGVISQLNDAARSRALRVGVPLQAALRAWLE